MSIELPNLPYEKDALAPHISKETIEFHYGKHHKGYVDKLNAAIVGTPWENKSLEDIILGADGGIFNNAAQIWNHTFYWHCLSPSGGGQPTGDLMEAIYTSFGSFESFKSEFTNCALTTFGSGWAWLIYENDKLEIISTSNAATPFKEQKQTLLTVDVWEHAYYIDYRNARPDYLNAFWNLVNWEFVSNNL